MDRQIPHAPLVTVSLYDVETLNIAAQTTAAYDVSKLSSACLANVLDTYVPLRSGAVFAIHCGPKIISRNRDLALQDITRCRLAIPGRFTSAFKATELLFGRLKNAVAMPYSAVIQAVARGTCDAGLVIHESVFSLGLHQVHEIVDIGKLFRKKAGFPLPLGVIVAKRSLGAEALQLIDTTLQRSIQLARSGPIPRFVFEHAQETSESTVRRHIKSYITDETERMDDRAFQFLMKFSTEASPL